MKKKTTKFKKDHRPQRKLKTTKAVITARRSLNKAIKNLGRALNKLLKSVGGNPGKAKTITLVYALDRGVYTLTKIHCGSCGSHRR
jgi:hypothetical protein